MIYLRGLDRKLPNQLQHILKDKTSKGFMRYFVVPLVNLVASDMLIVIFKPEVYCICVICSKQKKQKDKKGY